MQKPPRLLKYRTLVRLYGTCCPYDTFDKWVTRDHLVLEGVHRMQNDDGSLIKPTDHLHLFGHINNRDAKLVDHLNIVQTKTVAEKVCLVSLL